MANVMALRAVTREFRNVEEQIAAKHNWRMSLTAFSEAFVRDTGLSPDTDRFFVATLAEDAPTHFKYVSSQLIIQGTEDIILSQVELFRSLAAKAGTLIPAVFRKGWDSALNDPCSNWIRLFVEQVVLPVYPPSRFDLAWTLSSSPFLESACLIEKRLLGGLSIQQSESLHTLTFGPGYRSAKWRGQEFQFTVMQAGVVKLLAEASARGTPDVPGQQLLEDVDSCQMELKRLFRKHPAWNTLIVSGAKRGLRRLATSVDFVI